MSATALLQKAAQIGSTTTNNVNTSSSFNSIDHFGLMGSAVLNWSSNTNVDLHKIFKQPNIKSTNLGGGTFLLNDSSSRPFTSTAKGLRSSSNQEELGLTRDFLGVGGDSMSGPFLEQELAKFNAQGSASALDLSQYGAHQ
ncbi:protein indeterminate-domain 5, chloroplastic-like [Prosopis cineraria]|uniref:protein indeterminate-domain 5, chloroplastic-like n=1 Tax=Prosopis cineraria TaxID=364024 RepID=UPI00240F88EF|nr:protein indeterminate-domain 5, chloroplastic-like [Prosopis cineraria]